MSMALANEMQKIARRIEQLEQQLQALIESNPKAEAPAGKTPDEKTKRPYRRRSNSPDSE